MVFATEFDPNNQSAQARTLPPRSVTVSSIARSSSSIASSSVANNVVSLPSPHHPPLHLGSPAVRVRIDTDPSSALSLTLPKQPKLPLRLRLLNYLQQGSAVVTSLLVTGALVVYGSTVYVDKSTHRALIQLDTLQGESQQLTSANEAIKESLAEQATQPDSGLKPYDTGDMLFLTPEPPRKGAAPAAPAAPAALPGPLGY